MLISICLLVGVMFLIAGSKILVEGSGDIANRFHISSLSIGLTIVAFGTSIPELLVNLKAMSEGYQDIVIFNVIGSNIINILLILSLISFIKPLKLTNSTIKKELPLSIIVAFLFTILSLDDLFTPYKNNIITKSDSLVLILFFFVYIYYMYTVIKNRNEARVYEDCKYPLWYSIFMTILGFSMIVLGSIFTVDMAYKLTEFGISFKLFSLAIIAFSTSIPEIITCFHLMKINKEDMIIGNILGSNIFNVCITLAVPVIIMGNLNMNSLSVVDIMNFIVSSIILVLFAPIKQKLGKFEGIIMIFILIVYYSFTLWEGLGL